MAILKQGSLGIFTGKIGALVITKWKDKYVGKSKPKPSAKKASALQLSQRTKIRLAGKFMRRFKSVVSFSFQKVPKNMTAMNYAMWYNLRDAISGEYPDFTMDYAKVRLSEPADYATEIDNGYNVAVTVSGARISVAWEADELPDNDETKATDRAYFFCFHPEKNRFVSLESSQRSDLKIDLNLPDLFAGEVHMWLFFASDNLKYVSQTEYLGEFVIGF
ncbi:hypothetical protein TH53_13540 [Pedobacter lusitanus]|uniref:Uncharacterized protein n=1 Tax=Pedobacter lusitanus TaxID=1503925 RepID=A0A0D0FW44_9SPHI|nr:DUF6266 family protein [Pedobacter lusitanus]KIO76694.1 hypothetical protein TH53_13540 [Pedobacter lusitanus]